MVHRDLFCDFFMCFLIHSFDGFLGVRDLYACSLRILVFQRVLIYISVQIQSTTSLLQWIGGKPLSDSGAVESLPKVIQTVLQIALFLGELVRFPDLARRVFKARVTERIKGIFVNQGTRGVSNNT